MIKNDLNISDLEKYTFSKHSREIYDFEGFNSYSNNPLLNDQQLHSSNNYNNEYYSNQAITNNKQSSIININKDINYNQLNITHYNKSPLKKNYNNINNINNINIISQNEFNHNTNYNQTNKINLNRTKKKSFSKERKFDKRKFRTPDKNLNYNKFNFINSNISEEKIILDYNKSKDKNINYNENTIDKNIKKTKKRSLTQDNASNRNNRYNQITKNIIVNPIGYNKNININNVNIINQDSDLCDYKSKNYDSSSQYIYNDSNKENNIKTYNFSSSMKNGQKMNNIQKITEKILESNNIDSIDKKENNYYNYQESCFNTRLPRGAKAPIISKMNKNLNQSVIYSNKTPSPTRKNNKYLASAIYNSKSKKYLKYTRSVSSEPDIKKINNKLKHKYFKLRIFNKDYSPDNSFYKNSKEKYHVNNCINNKYNKNFNNFNTSCGNYKSSFYNNDKSSYHSNERNCNMTQPDFSKSLHNWNIDNTNNINKLLNKEDINLIKNLNNNQTNKDLYYKYLKYDSQNYNYQSYIESYYSMSKENQNTNNNLNSNKSLKSKKYNFEKYLNINNNTTKLSTNNNTYDENSNYTNSLVNKEIKNNKNIGTSTIEEVHLNFVNILQNTKNMMEKQEKIVKDRVIYNNSNSTTVILEEREIE